MVIEAYKCENCGKLTTNLMGVCDECEELGFWVDPVGGVHPPWEDDPAQMYE